MLGGQSGPDLIGHGHGHQETVVRDGTTRGGGEEEVAQQPPAAADGQIDVVRGEAEFVGRPDLVANPDVAGGHQAGRGPARVVGGETDLLEGQQILELGGGRRHHHLWVLTAGRQLGHTVQQGHLVLSLPGRITVAPAPGRQFAHGQTDHQEEDLGYEVLMMGDPERIEGPGQEEIEGQSGDQGGQHSCQSSPRAGHGHDDHDQKKGIVGRVEPAPPGDQDRGGGDGGEYGGHQNPPVPPPAHTRVGRVRPAGR